MKKKKGAVEFILALTVVSIFCILFLFQIKVRMLKATNNYIGDGLDGACLAAALINLECLGTSSEVRIDDYSRAYETFRSSLKENLNLDDAYRSDNEWQNCDSINIRIFIIYNIKDSKLITTIYEGWSDSPTEFIEQPYTGTETTPDGSRITSATVYGSVDVMVKGFVKESKYVSRECSVDVTK